MLKPINMIRNAMKPLGAILLALLMTLSSPVAAQDFQKGFAAYNAVAHMWYNIGAANGNELSGTNRDIVAKRMTPAAIEKAQAMARECMSSGYTKCGE